MHTVSLFPSSHGKWMILNGRKRCNAFSRISSALRRSDIVCITMRGRRAGPQRSTNSEQHYMPVQQALILPVFSVLRSFDILAKLPCQLCELDERVRVLRLFSPNQAYERGINYHSSTAGESCRGSSKHIASISCPTVPRFDVFASSSDFIGMMTPVIPPLV
jgi:hypothetical protein